MSNIEPCRDFHLLRKSLYENAELSSITRKQFISEKMNDEKKRAKLAICMR